MTRETMKRRKETAGVIRKIDAHDMAKHEPTENAKKWMKRKAYSVEDCLSVDQHIIICHFQKNK